MMYAINVMNLKKFYGSFNALDGLNFKVDENEIHGFLGPNGAGKTTTVRIMMGLTQSDGGEVLIYGDKSDRKDFSVISRIGYMPERPSLPKHLTSDELLDIYGQIYGLPVNERKNRGIELLELVGLSNYADKKIETFSKGMRQRLGIAQSLISDPDLLILDEPTSGLDPGGRAKIRSIIRGIGGNGITIFISSHLLEEIEKICDRVTIISEGKCIISESVEYLSKTRDAMILDIHVADLNDGVMRSVEDLSEVESLERDGESLRVFVREGDDPRVLISKTITREGGTIIGMTRKSRSLEDVFLEATQGSEDDQLR